MPNQEAQHNVIAFGELLWDCLPSGKVLGGAPANFALRLEELGIHCHLVSKIGQDELGEEALKELTTRSMDISGVQVDSKYPTGTVPIEISPEGNASYTITKNVAFDFVDFTNPLMNRAREASAFYYGSLTSRTQHNRETLQQILDTCTDSCVKILDINLRKDCWDLPTLDFLLQNADILKLNDEEAKLLWEQWQTDSDFSLSTFANYVIQEYNLRICVITKGAEGAFALDNTGNVAEIAGKSVEIVDTIGSGDAFTAAFLAGILRNKSLDQSCKEGNDLGAKVATTKGGMTPLMS